MKRTRPDQCSRGLSSEKSLSRRLSQIIAGAVLDTTVTEPLPIESKLCPSQSLDNAHMAGATRESRRGLSLLEWNLSRYGCSSLGSCARRECCPRIERSLDTRVFELVSRKSRILIGRLPRSRSQRVVVNAPSPATEEKDQRQTPLKLPRK